jgi:hypothetical protein
MKCLDSTLQCKDMPFSTIQISQSCPTISPQAIPLAITPALHLITVRHNRRPSITSTVQTTSRNIWPHYASALSPRDTSNAFTTTSGRSSASTQTKPFRPTFRTWYSTARSTVLLPNIPLKTRRMSGQSPFSGSDALLCRTASERLPSSS